MKLFLELELYEPALLVLSGIMASDDQEVEAWYLEGWCFFMMTERAQENGGTFNDLTWEQLARDGRDCLDTCQMVRRSHFASHAFPKSHFLAACEPRTSGRASARACP